MKNMKSGKGQVFTWDVIIATVLFLAFLVLFIYLWAETENKINMAELQYEISWLSTAVSEGLVRTPGSPVNWTLDPDLSGIKVLGLSDIEVYGNDTEPLDRILDADKLVYFINHTKTRYRETRNKLFGTGKYDYYVELYCADDHSMDCFNNLMTETIDNTRVGCDDSTAFYIKNHTVRTDLDLAASFRLDEGTGNDTYDSSGNPNKCVLKGANWSDGKYGKSAHFDGVDDYAYCGNVSDAGNAKEFTLSAWVKSSTWSTATSVGSILNKGPEMPVQHFWFGIWYPTTPNPSHLFLELGDASSWYHLNGSTLSWSAGQWYHVAASFKNSGGQSNVTFYRNGMSVGSQIVAKDLDSGGYELLIGRYALTGSNHFFKGDIDDVKIWNRSLTAVEILNEYQKDKRSCVAGLNTSINNSYAFIYDVKTITFREGADMESVFNEDIVSLDPTARLKIAIYRKR